MILHQADCGQEETLIQGLSGPNSLKPTRCFMLTAPVPRDSRVCIRTCRIHAMETGGVVHLHNMGDRGDGEAAVSRRELEDTCECAHALSTVLVAVEHRPRGAEVC